MLEGLFTVKGAPQISRVTSLPGFNGTLPSEHYSGYVTLGENPPKELFYYFVVSERNPASDPVVLWLNGGPGCSSLDDFVYEHGIKRGIKPVIISRVTWWEMGCVIPTMIILTQSFLMLTKWV